MTVADLEGRLTMREVVHWGKFQEEFGPLTLHERIDAVGAMIASTVAASAGAEVEPSDFLIDWKERPAPSAVDWLSATSRKAG